jgi:hypothetical protein
VQKKSATTLNRARLKKGHLGTTKTELMYAEISLYNEDALLLLATGVLQCPSTPTKSEVSSGKDVGGMGIGQRIRNLVSPTGSSSHVSRENWMVQNFRETTAFDRKLNVILHNPEFFRLFQKVVVQSRHFSPTGVSYQLNDFMEAAMPLVEVLADIEAAGQKVRRPLTDFGYYENNNASPYKDIDEGSYISPLVNSSGHFNSSNRANIFTKGGAEMSPIECSYTSYPDHSWMSPNPCQRHKGKRVSRYSRLNSKNALDTDDQSVRSAESYSTGISLPSLDHTVETASCSDEDSVNDSLMSGFTVRRNTYINSATAT